MDADICNLRPVLDQLASCKTDLQLQCEALTEEMCCLKTNHEEVSSLGIKKKKESPPRGGWILLIQSRISCRK